MSKTAILPGSDREATNLDLADLANRLLALERQVKELAPRVGDVKATFQPVTGLTGEQEVEPSWLLINGAERITRATWPELFDLLGVEFNGASTQPDEFGLPSGVGRTLVAKSDGGTFGNAGATGGVETVTLTAAQSGRPAATVDLNAPGQVYYDGPGAVKIPATGSGAEFDLWTVPDVSIPAVGASQAHDNMPPYLVAEGFLIYAGLKQG